MQLPRICAVALLLMLVLSTAGCSDDFFLSEKEVRAYANVLVTQSNASLYFDNLQGRTITLQFDNSTGVPRLQSSNLLAEMRRTELAQLETGPAAVSLDRLREELETQIGNWASGRLELYTSDQNDLARLTRLDSVSVRFMNDPTFTYDSQRQSVDFDVRMTIIINGTIEVNAVSWLVNLFTGINGTYPLQIVVNDMRLQGEANLMPMYATAGQIDFRLVPQILGTIDVNDTTTSIPSQVKTGIQTVLSHNFAAHADQIFTQNYDYFALTGIRLSPDTPSRLSVCYRPKANRFGPSLQGPAESTNPMLHLVTRATDGKLYHARKREGSWTSYSALPRPSPSPSATPIPRIDNDPALVHSGGDQLELAATDAAGNVVYAHWRDEQWLNWWTIKPNINYTPAISYRGKPAVVASAPGQVEIIVAGSDGRLWHLRRYDGVWQTPVQVPPAAGVTYPLHDPSATIARNEILLSYLDSANHLYAQPYDMASNTWGTSYQLPTQESIPYAPTAVTWSDDTSGEVIIVYAGQSGSAYSFEINLGLPVPSFSRSTERTIGGLLNAPPVVIASNNRTLELIGRWTDNRLRHNHYFADGPKTVDGRTVNQGWQGWQPMTDNLVGSPVYTDGRMAEFALAATPTGRVELAARGLPSPGAVPSGLFHNSYESDRFGSAPWKTVQWRGYELAGSQQAVGRPALVAVDQNFQIAFESPVADLPGLTLNDARLSASNLTSFIRGPGVRTAAAAINPVVLSTGLGITDYFYIGDDSRLHHDRRSPAWRGGQTFTPAMPVGIQLASQLAVDGYGNGEIELAARGSDSRIYHWRFSEGAWSAPVAVASSMASAPILLHVGAAHLELLAVDFDHKVCRWRFNGTSWSSRIPVSSTFRINENLFRQSSASSWGDGTVDLVVVSLDTKELYHRRIGPDDEICTMPIGCPAPRTFNKIGGAVIDTPVLTAFSPEKMNVLFLQSSLSWFSSWSYMAPSQPITFPPKRDLVLNWTAFQDMGAKEMVIGASANSGARNYVAVAIDFNGHVLLNRISDGRWTGFHPVGGQLPEMVLPSPMILPTIAAHGG